MVDGLKSCQHISKTCSF